MYFYTYSYVYIHTKNIKYMVAWPWANGRRRDVPCIIRRVGVDEIYYCLDLQYTDNSSVE